MIDYGHLCLLVFAQGTWKENYKERLVKQISENFISTMEIDDTDLWNEIQKSPLFSPKDSGVHDKSCEVCHALFEIFEITKGNNDGLIFFSHNILGWKAMKRFLLFILGEVNVKKVYYLELDQFSYLISASKKIPEIINEIKHLKIKRTEFFKLFENQKIEFSTLYEVGKY